MISLEPAISAPINTFYNGGPYLHPLRFISPIETFYVWRGYRRRIDDSATNALANRIVDLLLIDRGNYQSTPYFFLSIVPAKRQNERSGRKQASKIDREFRRCKWNPIAYPRSTCVCVCVCTSARLAPRVFQDICTCVRSWTTTKDTRVKTGTKFTLVDTFSATKSRRLRFRGSPSNPNTSGKEWYWLRKWGHRVWFHCVAMVHRPLIARTWALPDPSLLNSPYELSNVDTL